MNDRLSIQTELEQWAKTNGLRYETFEHWDETTGRVQLQDSGGDLYEFWVASDDTFGAKAGVSLVKRGAAKHRTFRREREEFSFVEHVPPSGVRPAIESCLVQVRRWVSAAGHQLSGIVAGA